MSKPNPDIIKAIFDSYFTIRNPWWNLVVGSEVNVPKDEKARIKVLTAAKFISDAQNCKTTADWVNYIIKIHEVEMAEMKAGNDKWLLVKMVTDHPLLAYTLMAVRAYIVSNIKDEQYQTSIKDNLDHIHAFQDNVDYHNRYFLDFTRPRDHRGLNEKSFEDFKNNVVSGKRTSDIANLLLSKNINPEVEQEAKRAADEQKAKELKALEEAKKARIEAQKLAAKEQEKREEERRRTEENARIEIAEKAKREDELRRAEEKAKRDYLQARTAEIAEVEKREQERRRAEEKVKMDAEKARHEEERRRIEEKAKREDEQRRAAEKAKREADKARREEERRRKAEELQKIYVAEEIAAREQHQLTSQSDNSKTTLRQRHASVTYNPSMFAPGSTPTQTDPMEIDSYYKKSSRPSRRQ